MQVVAWFRFGPVHVPYRRRGWNAGEEFEVGDGKREATLRVLPPVRIGTHEVTIDGDTRMVTDAVIPVGIACAIEDNPDDYRFVSELAFNYLSRIVEGLRVKTRQAQLRIRRLSELRAVAVTTLDEIDVPQLTQGLQQWLEDQDLDQQLPLLESRDDWLILNGAMLSRNLESEDPFSTALHDSLLLDAKYEGKSDIRIAILYSALACEVFIQRWLEQRAKSDSLLNRFLEWSRDKRHPERSVSVRGYFDIGVYLATKCSMKEEKQLWSDFERLISTRNDIAHRGQLSKPGQMSAQQAVRIAERVIRWVEGLSS